MNIKKHILIIGCILTQCVAFAQEGIPVYSDYLADNWYLLHPSMAGASTKSTIRLTARQQWFDLEDAPNLQTLAVQTRIGEKVGVGGILFNDQNGYFSQSGAYATFAYHLSLSGNYRTLSQLSFGMSVGLIQSRLDESNFDLIDFDPVITGGQQSDSYMNVDLGMSYNYMDFSFHAAIKNALPAKREIFTEGRESRNQRRFITSLSYNISRQGSPWSFEPSVMFQGTDRTQEATGDANLKAYRKMDWGRLWGGLSYRRSFDGAEFSSNGEAVDVQKLSYITPFVGGNYGRFMFAYTYSYQNNSVVLTNGGFHQITIGYDFGDNREPYDCNCPAVN